MECLICHSDKITLQEVNEEIKYKNDIVYVPVKIMVCRNCGERYFDRKTLKYLEYVENSVKKEKASLKEVGKVLILN